MAISNKAEVTCLKGNIPSRQHIKARRRGSAPSGRQRNSDTYRECCRQKTLALNNKAQYFSVDAILAGAIIVGLALLLLNANFYETDTEQKQFLTQDVLMVLSTLTIADVQDNSYVAAEIANGNITDLNNSVLEQIGIYWAFNETTKSQALFSAIVNESLLISSGFDIVIEDDTIFSKNATPGDNTVAGRRMISGIAKGAPLQGFSSSAYLTKINNKKTNAYSYFGGFFGQGNWTQRLELANDFDASRFIEATLRLETPGDFTVDINGNSCGGTYTGAADTVQAWDLAACNASFVSGVNNITVNFVSPLNESYIAGGYVRVTYTTDILNEGLTPGYKRYYFPEVSGFINLYDAVAAQGLIQNWTVNLTIYNEYDTFLTVGNETIFVLSGSNVTQNVLFTRLNQTLAPTQLPVRLGTTNLSNITVLQAGTPSDSFLVTDVSGSMDDCGLYQNVTQEMCGYEYFFWFWWIYTECPMAQAGTCVSNECGGTTTTRNHNIFNDTSLQCNATLLELAQAADKLFVSVVLNNTGNNSLHEVGLVDFSNDANPYTALTSNEAVLDAEIDTYNANGGTCTCCGINRARDLINVTDDEKFIIVLSDGEPTRYCTSYNDYTGSSGNDALSESWAIDAAQAACSSNITVYAIGFGEGMSAQGHSVMQQIACNSSLYYNATNVSELAEIYDNISNQILVAANYSSQTISIVGNYSTAQIIGDSYMDLWFDPILTDNVTGKISLVFETDEFSGCSEVVTIPQNVVIQDASITSFSSNHWTKSVIVNDVTVFNLTEYGTDYSLLGDPFTIQIPSALLNVGAANTITLDIGDSPVNSSACSLNNTLQYTALINSSTPRTETLEELDGCTWSIQSESDVISTLDAPSGYSGSNTCTYNETIISYDASDAYDVVIIDLLQQLDPDGNGKIIVDLEEADLEITISTVSNIPYLWGPSTISTRAWN